jgi:hypothetical protein
MKTRKGRGARACPTISRAFDSARSSSKWHAARPPGKFALILEGRSVVRRRPSHDVQPVERVVQSVEQTPKTGGYSIQIAFLLAGRAEIVATITSDGANVRIGSSVAPTPRDTTTRKPARR